MATNKLEMVLTVPADASVSGFTRLRHYTIDNNPWWAASDVGAVLGIKNTRSTVALFPDDEKGVHTVDTLGGRQNISVINEPGLWRLVLKSRVAEAERLKRWLCWEVLPSIRKHGCCPPPAVATVEKPPPGCEWVDVVRSLADGQREIATEVIRLDRKIDTLTDLVNTLGTGVAHLMKTQTQPPAISPPPARPARVTRQQKESAIRSELTRDPHRTDGHIVSTIGEKYHLSVHRESVAKYRREMEQTREIEPATKRKAITGKIMEVKYDPVDLPFHTTVDKLD